MLLVYDYEFGRVVSRLNILEIFSHSSLWYSSQRIQFSVHLVWGSGFIFDEDYILNVYLRLRLSSGVLTLFSYALSFFHQTSISFSYPCKFFVLSFLDSFSLFLFSPRGVVTCWRTRGSGCVLLSCQRQGVPPTLLLVGSWHDGPRLWLVSLHPRSQLPPHLDPSCDDVVRCDEQALISTRSPGHWPWLEQRVEVEQTAGAGASRWSLWSLSTALSPSLPDSRLALLKLGQSFSFKTYNFYVKLTLFIQLFNIILCVNLKNIL